MDSLVEIFDDDNFIIDMMYASLKNNMTGVAVYQEIGLGNRALVHKDLWQKLQQAIPYLQTNNLKMKICDAYRPAVAHERMREIIPQPGFFASCAERSKHCHATAVDVCLCDKNGVELVYPTKVDAFDAVYAKQVQSGNLAPFFEYLQKARLDYEGADKQAQANRAQLQELMEGIGLESNPAEWWHYGLFDGADNSKYPVIEFK